MTDETFPEWQLDAVDAAAMHGWVDLLRDDNPIHVDPAAAGALGFGPRTVNPGPINLAYALNMLMAARPGSYPATIEARFLGNVFAGEAVEVTGAADADDPLACHAEVRANGTVALEVSVRMMPEGGGGS